MNRVFVLSVALLTSSAIPAVAADATYRDLWLASAKMNPLFDADAAVDSYMQLFRPTIWQRYQHDEFSLHKQEQASLPVMQQAIADYDVKTSKDLSVPVSLGEYDFKSHMFPLTLANIQPGQTAYWYVQQPSGTGQGMPFRFKIFLSNLDAAIGQLPLDDVAAKALVDRHRGAQARTLTAHLTYVIDKLAGEDEFTGRVIRVQYLDPAFGNQTIATVDVGLAAAPTESEHRP